MFRLLLIVFCLVAHSLAYVPAPANAQKMDAKAAPLPDIKLHESNAVKRLPVPVTVKTVIDPLTFTDTDGNVYRLMELDSPALSDTGETNKPLYGEMKKSLEALISDQSLLLYVPLTRSGEAEQMQNRMGHTLVQAVREKDKIWVQGILLNQGMARVRTTPDETVLAADLLRQEDKARKVKRGLWKDADYAVFAADHIPDNFYGFGIVEGTIHSVSAVRNTIFLNFGDNWREDFSLGLSPEARRAFAKDGANVMSWGGEHVRVRGNIRQYNGAFIDLDHSAQVEHLDDNAEQKSASEAADTPLPEEGSGGNHTRSPAAEERDNHIPFNL